MAKNKNLPINSAEKMAKKQKFKWTKKKIIAASIIGVSVISAVIFLVIVLVNNLGRIRPIESTEEEARVVGEMGGYEVRYEELRYITLLHKASLDKRFGEYDSLDAEGKAEYEKELEKNVLEDLKNNYVVLALCEKYDIDTDSRKVNNHVQKKIEELVYNSKENSGFDGDKDAYVEWLKENNLTDSFLRFIYKVDYLETELLDYFVENRIDVKYTSENKDEFSKYVMECEGWVRTIHVYYPDKHPWSNRSNIPSEIKKLESAEKYISEVISKYDPKGSIENSYANVSSKKYDDDRYTAMRSAVGKTPVTELAVSGNGFYFTYGQMGKEYEKIAFELDEYEISEIFRYENGYCFMMRLPLLEDDVKKNCDSLLSQYQYLVVKNHLDAERENMSFVGNDYFSGISLIGIE